MKLYRMSLESKTRARAPRVRLGWITVLIGAFIFSLVSEDTARATKLRDLANFRGMRENQLVGYGLIMGLDGTGDRKGTGFTLRSMSNLLESVGLTVPPTEMNVKNVAAVMVTAKMPPFGRPGNKIDVTVASIGDASSLQGGILVQTPLEGADGRVYAVAQGPVSVGGFAADTPGGSSVSQNHVTVGRVPAGGIIEREVGGSNWSGDLELGLIRPDVTTAQRVVEAINETGNEAIAIDPATIRISVDSTKSRVAVMAELEILDVKPSSRSRVVINERTGTIVAGGDVEIRPVAIAHGNLSIRIDNATDVYAPAPFSPDGTDTAYADQSDISVETGGSAMMSISGTSTLAELAEALNTLGVTPRDVIAIFQALKEAGALDAELIII